MNNFLSFQEFSNNLNEGFVLNGDTLFFDSNSTDFINTKFGKDLKNTPYSMKLPFGVMYSVYSKNKNTTSEEYTEILKCIKGQSTKYKIDLESYNKFLNRTAFYMSKIILNNDIQTIILMESSSKLLSDLNLKLIHYLPKYYTIFNYEHTIFKNPDISSIKIDAEAYKLDDKTVQSLRKTLDNMDKSGYFSVKRFPPQFRKVITNWLKLTDKMLSKIVDKNIVIIDDILTTGSTIIEASNLIKNAGAKNLIGLSIIKG